jgi:hypothetical protein
MTHEQHDQREHAVRVVLANKGYQLHENEPMTRAEAAKHNIPLVSCTDGEGRPVPLRLFAILKDGMPATGLIAGDDSLYAINRTLEEVEEIAGRI